MTEYVLRTRQLVKSYQNKIVLDGIEMKIQKGAIYGFIGQNGAGKSTTIRIINGLAKQTKDSFELFGQHKPADLVEARKRMGCIIEASAFYPNIMGTRVEAFKHTGFLLQPDLGRVTANEAEIKLTSREYDILHLLMSNPKKVFSKANLFESVWGERYFEDDNVVNAQMSRLRSKLTQARAGEELIETIWGMGYRLKP